MGVLPRLALCLLTMQLSTPIGGLVGLGGTACAAEPAPAVGNEQPRTVECPDAQCTVTATPGTVVDLGDAGTMTVTDVGSRTVTTSSGGSRITSTAGGTNTLDDVTYRVTEVRDGQATLVFGESDTDPA